MVDEVWPGKARRGWSGRFFICFTILKIDFFLGMSHTE